MTTALGLIVLFGILAAVTWFMFVGQDKILRSRTKQRVQAGEEVVFESTASRSSTGIGVMFSFRKGFVVVTNYRLLFGSWSLPPFWTSITETPLMDLDKISVIGIFGMNQVHLSIRGKTLMLTPRGGAFLPFSNQRTEQFVAALKQGSGRAPETSDLGPHIRKRLGQGS
jgi:hypothetical protein